MFQLMHRIMVRNSESFELHFNQQCLMKKKKVKSHHSINQQLLPTKNNYYATFFDSRHTFELAKRDDHLLARSFFRQYTSNGNDILETLVRVRVCRINKFHKCFSSYSKLIFINDIENVLVHSMHKITIKTPKIRLYTYTGIRCQIRDCEVSGGYVCRWAI